MIGHDTFTFDSEPYKGKYATLEVEYTTSYHPPRTVSAETLKASERRERMHADRADTWRLLALISFGAWGFFIVMRLLQAGGVM